MINSEWVWGEVRMVLCAMHALNLCKILSINCPSADGQRVCPCGCMPHICPMNVDSSAARPSSRWRFALIADAAVCSLWQARWHGGCGPSRPQNNGCGSRDTFDFEGARAAHCLFGDQCVVCAQGQCEAIWKWSCYAFSTGRDGRREDHSQRHGTDHETHHQHSPCASHGARQHTRSRWADVAAEDKFLMALRMSAAICSRRPCGSCMSAPPARWQPQVLDVAQRKPGASHPQHRSPNPQKVSRSASGRRMDGQAPFLQHAPTNKRARLGATATRESIAGTIKVQQCPNSARTVPEQCPNSAPYSAPL